MAIQARMNRFGGKQHTVQLAALSQIPTQQELTDMLATAQQTPGLVVSTRFKIAATKLEYELETVLPATPKEMAGKGGLSVSDPSWTLWQESPFYKGNGNNGTLGRTGSRIWQYSTGDVGLIANLLLSEATGTTQENTESIDLSLLGGILQRTNAALAKAKETNANLPPFQPPEANPEAIATRTGENAALNISLAGELTDVDLSDVLQAITICKMTGRLDLHDRLDQAELFFEDGALIHAQLLHAINPDQNIVGDQVVLDVITWETGSFFFHRGRNTRERTIKRKLEGMLLEGAGLSDYRDFLRKSKIQPDSILEKSPIPLTPDELKKKLLDGVPIDINQQLRLFEMFDGSHTLGDVIARAAMPKSVWLPIAFNLINTHVIVVRKQDGTDPNSINQFVIDDQLIRQEARTLMRLDSGLPSYMMMLSFLKQELARSSWSRLPFALIAMSVTTNGDPIPRLAIQQLSEEFEKYAEPFDVLGHFQGFDYLMLLPFRNEEQALDIMTVFADCLQKTKLDGVSDSSLLTFRVGIATPSPSSDEMAAILSSADDARKAAIARDQFAVTGRDLRWERLKTKGEELAKAKQFVEAETVLGDAFKEAEYFSLEDPRLIQTAEMLISVLQSNQKHAVAESLFKLLIDSRRRTAGPNSKEVADLTAALAHSLFIQKKYEESSELLQSVISIWIAIGGEIHPAVASYSFNLGKVLHTQGKLEEAKYYYKRAADINATIFGPTNPNTTAAQESYDRLVGMTSQTMSGPHFAVPEKRESYAPAPQ